MRGNGKRKGITRKTEINMIPFLDVLLTMLLIFMIATPTVNSSIDVNVPRSTQGKATEDINAKDILILEVHTDSTFTILFNTKKFTDLSSEQVKVQINRLIENLKFENKGSYDLSRLIVQVAADEAANYGSVINALTLVKAYGFNDVGLITKSIPKNK